MNNIIQLENVAKYYEMGENLVKAVDGINIEIKKGDFVAIMGPSGSGKSTAMNLVGSLDLPTKGEIYLEGHDIAHLDESQLAQIRGKKVGFIFQSFNLIPNLTAKENVMLPMLFQEIDEEEREERAEKLLKLVDLEDRMDHYPTQLSGGQQQRVAIARSLVMNPAIILADEPTGNIASTQAEEIMAIFQKLNDEGRTIIMITHEADIAEHAKRIIHIRDGKIVEDGNGHKQRKIRIKT